MTSEIRHERARSYAVVAAAMLLGLIATLLVPAPVEASYSDVVVIANRGSGDLSVIHTASLSETRIDLPGAAEPMYVNQDKRNGLVLVGDRAASKVVALDQYTLKVVDSVSVGAGVFHQWYDEKARQLWVVGDTSQTVSVVDTKTMSVIATIDMPAELVAAGGKPHDVFVSGKYAFVSILGVGDILGTGDGHGVVLQYSTRTFAETGRATVGDDPHLFVVGNDLYVASQDGSTVSRHNVRTLAELSSKALPAAHGLFVTNRGQVLVTNIAGGGTNAVNEIDKKLKTVRSTADTSFPVPHNLTVDRNWHAWVTHSGGTANQVSAIDLNSNGLGAITTITVGTNPFGLAFIDR